MDRAADSPGPPAGCPDAGLALDLLGLLTDGAGQQDVQRLLLQSQERLQRITGSRAQPHASRACSILAAAAGTQHAVDAPTAHPISTSAGSTRQQRRELRGRAAAASAALLGSVAFCGRNASRKPVHLPRPAAPPTDYLADVGRAVAALSGRSPGTSAPATPGAADEVQRAVQDGREVAAELVPCASDPSRCRLHLRALAQGRSQAAIAAKLGPATAARQARLRQQLQGEAARRQHERATLRSSQRAALLGLSLSAPHPTPLAALARVLRGGLQRAQQQQQGGGRAAGGQPSLAAHLRSRNAAVLDQHKAMRKAWREKRKQEAAARMAALRANDFDEYLRQAQQHSAAHKGKIAQLLDQTDSCLRELAARLRSAGTGPALQATAAAGGSPSLSGSPQLAGRGGGGAGVAALEQSHEAWNQLAAAFQADVAGQPALLTGGQLRDYQMQGLRWLAGLHRQGLNGILADEMGLGKTVQVIALACHLVGEAAAAAPAPGGGSAAAAARPFLIAAPSSVLPNWEAELRRWAPGLKVVAYKGAADEREAVWTRQLRGGRGGGAGAGTHVVLTSYDFLMGKNDKPRLARVHWGYIVIDEGHRLKNAACKLNAELRGYRADHRLLLSGTPLQNGLNELWSLLNFLQPALFDSGEDFMQWFGGAGRRAPACGSGDSSDDEGAAEAAMLSEEEALIVTNRLHQVLRPFMLRRLKEGVASELPAKVERLLPVLPSPYQRALFGLMQRDLQDGKGGKGEAIRGVNNILMELRNICNHPLISRLHPEGAELLLPAHSLPAEVRLCAKLELLDRVLPKLKAGGHKVLLFCTMTRALDVIEDYLDWRGFSHLRLDGSTSAAERGDLIDRFNDPAGGAFVFLLSLRAGGQGLNLQGADTVIMYDTDFNPQMDLQAQARAHRMGQKKEVLVLRLKTAGSVEERAIAVASEKAQLADRSITGGFFDGKTSEKERQRYLLETIRTSAAAAQRAQQGGPRGGAGAGASGAEEREGEGGQLSDAELNALLARGEEELELFAAEDRRRQAAELAAWRASQRCAPGIAGAAAAAAAGGGGGSAYSRLATEAEVAPLVHQAQELLWPKKEEDEGLELGRGKRQRGAAAYRDLPEGEFVRLVNEGVEAGQAAVPLLAPAGGRPAAAAQPVAAQQGAPAPPSKRRKLAVGEAAVGAAAADEPPAAVLHATGAAKLPAAPAAAAGTPTADLAPRPPVPTAAAAAAEPARQHRKRKASAADSGAAKEQQQPNVQVPPAPGMMRVKQEQQEWPHAHIPPPPRKLGRAALRSYINRQEQLLREQASGRPAAEQAAPHASEPSAAAPVVPAQQAAGEELQEWHHAHIPPPLRKLGGAALRSYINRQEQLLAEASGQPLSTEPAAAGAAGPPAAAAQQAAGVKRQLDEAEVPASAKRAPQQSSEPAVAPSGAAEQQAGAGARQDWPHSHIPPPPRKLGGAALRSYINRQEQLLAEQASSPKEQNQPLSSGPAADAPPAPAAADPAPAAPEQQVVAAPEQDWPHAHILPPPRKLGGAALRSYINRQEQLLREQGSHAKDASQAGGTA